jgi:hypothetical protein
MGVDGDGSLKFLSNSIFNKYFVLNLGDDFETKVEFQFRFPEKDDKISIYSKAVSTEDSKVEENKTNSADSSSTDKLDFEACDNDQNKRKR